MKTILLILMITLMGIGASAQKKNKNAKYVVEVNGNCDQCKKRIEKAAFGVSGVKSASWEVESHRLTLYLNEEKTDVRIVAKALAKAGHDNEFYIAGNNDYDSLHECCQYVRE